MKNFIKTFCLFIVSIIMTSCSGFFGYEADGNSIPQYSVSGVISGLNASGVQLTLNNSETISVGSDGNISFQTLLANNESYSITVSGQPSDVNCSVMNAEGTAGQDISNLYVFCTDQACINQQYIVGAADGTESLNAGVNCHWIKLAYPSSADGVYWLDVDGKNTGYDPFRAYCDMTTDGGGWTLVNKTMYTENGPSKIEMTGDATLSGLSVDPWPSDNGETGGAMDPSAFLDLGSFTTPQNPDYFPLGFRGDLLQTPIDAFLPVVNLEENYATMDRNIIDSMRSNGYCGVRNDSRIVQRQSGQNFYIQSSKRFNPIQHKCIDSLSTCTAADLSGCAADFITVNEIYSSYNSSTNAVSSPLTENDLWTATCNFGGGRGVPSGQGPGTEVILGWGATNSGATLRSGFYELTNAGTGSGSGPLSQAATLASCNDETNCPYTTVWIK